MDDAAAVSEVLDDRPELEDPLRAVLDVDDENEAWTFDDLPIDSGAFGELVSRGLVERTDDGDAYRLADPAAVRAALDRGGSTDDATATDDAAADDDATATFSSPSTTDLSLDTSAITDRFAAVDRQTVGAVAAALLAVVLARAYVYGTVFRGGDVVLSANDPYYYRYWVEQALAESNGAFDVSALGTISGAVQTGEPLLVATLWFFSSLVGGDATAAGWVLAWYPVIAGVLTAFLVYLLAMRVTDDRRIALAATVLLAVTPAHAMRTSLGFADHHAFDYVWLMVTAYALVRLDADAGGRLRDPGRWAWAVVLGIGIAGQILAWDAGPLLVVPLGIYVSLRVFQDMRTGASPVRAHLHLVAGVGIGTVAVFLGYTQIGWLSRTVAFTPVLLLFGVVCALVAGELAVRFDASPWSVVVVGAVGVGGALFALRTLSPAYWENLTVGLRLLTASREIAETQSLLNSGAFGWLLLFGFVLVLAVPYLVWASARVVRGGSEWLVPTVYCWYFLALAVLQVRFAGQLAMFACVFAGLGFVHLADRVDLTAPPVPFEGGPGSWRTVSFPDLRTVGYILVLFALVASLSLVQVPIKISQVTTDGNAHQSASWMAGYADERGWEYPSNYVFSSWSQNRMYNYFVNGQAESYGYAQRNYELFAASHNGSQWYYRLQDRAGFVVVGDQRPRNGSIYDQLAGAYGGRTERAGGLSHYRAVYTTGDGERTVYTLVPGSTITGHSPSLGGAVETGTTVRLPSTEFTYEQRTSVSAGVYTVTVPYPGNYTLGNQSVTVTEADVRNGTTHSLFDGPGVASWSFDEGDGSLAYDRWGGYHLRVNASHWTDDGIVISEESVVRSPDETEFLTVDRTESLTLRFTIRGDLSASSQTYPKVFSAVGTDESALGLWSRNNAGDFGVRLYDANGTIAQLFDIETTRFESPTNVTVVLDRGTDELRLYRNDSLAGTRNVSDLGTINLDRRVLMGGFVTADGAAPVVVSDFRVYERVLSPTDEPPAD